MIGHAGERANRRLGALGLVLTGWILLCMGGPGMANVDPDSATSTSKAESEAKPLKHSGVILLAVIDGSINPASADYLIQAIARAEREHAAMLLIEMDTPGGLVSSTQDIIKAMLNAEVPVVVYVTPRGAWASSAGTFITIASTVAAMAPGSSIGAASPIGVFGDGGSDEEGDDSKAKRDVAARKAQNLLASYIESIAKQKKRNVEWAAKAVRNAEAATAEEALELGVIDLVAEDRAELLDAIEGREVEVAGDAVILTAKGARVEPVDMTLLQKIFNVLASPDLAVILLIGGLLGLYVEFNSPGLIVPAVIGVVCLVLLGFSLQILPFSWIGLLLVLIGMGLLVAEIFITSFGMLFAAGIALFLLGGTMVFDQPEASDLNVSFWEVLVPVVGALGTFAAVIVYAVGRTIFQTSMSGTDEMLGGVGRVAAWTGAHGKVFIRGEYWNAVSDPGVEIGDGSDVEVVAVDGLTLRVRPRSENA